jgi:23S rRNA pseudouridine1911/1915/1917 synthase
VTEGRVSVDGARASDSAKRVAPGETIRVHERSASPPASSLRSILYEDRHLVVADKPPGISSVPYVRGERGTLMDEIRAEWKKRGVPSAARVLYVVHRLDKDSSGLLIYARSRDAERALQQQFRARAVSRLYLCLAHGRVNGGRIETRLLPDRGDGLRGSAPPGSDRGKPAITEVKVLERFRLATLCEVRLETGRTHQIRIHLAERGHPLVGERVYIRDFVARGGKPIPSPRLLLHASELRFDHPIDRRRVSFTSKRTAEFRSLVDVIAFGG